MIDRQYGSGYESSFGSYGWVFDSRKEIIVEHVDEMEILTYGCVRCICMWNSFCYDQISAVAEKKGRLTLRIEVVPEVKSIRTTSSILCAMFKGSITSKLLLDLCTKRQISPQGLCTPLLSPTSNICACFIPSDKLFARFVAVASSGTTTTAGFRMLK